LIWLSVGLEITGSLKNVTVMTTFAIRVYFCTVFKAHNWSITDILTILSEPRAVHSQFLCLMGHYITDEMHYRRNYGNSNNRNFGLYWVTPLLPWTLSDIAVFRSWISVIVVSCRMWIYSLVSNPSVLARSIPPLMYTVTSDQMPGPIIHPDAGREIL